MATALATLVTDLGYNIGQTISATTTPSTTQANVLLNRALKKVVKGLRNNNCFRPLALLTKEVNYTLDGSTDFVSLYTLLGDSVDYYDYVSGTMGDYPLRVVTIEEEHKLKTSGEYYPTISQPYMVMWQYDVTNEITKVAFRPKASTQKVYLRFFRKVPTMTASVNSCLPEYCDEAVTSFASVLAWAGYRESTERQMWMGMHKDEMTELYQTYAETTSDDVWYFPVA